MADFVSKLFGFDKYDFDSISINTDLIRDLCEMASNAYPKEFFAYLEGEIKNKELIINGLLVQPYEASTNQAVYRLSDMPMSSKMIGTVHSHPGSGGPSRADIKSFSQTGLVHLIIEKPYTEQNVHLYDLSGNELHFSKV